MTEAEGSLWFAFSDGDTYRFSLADLRAFRAGLFNQDLATRVSLQFCAALVAHEQKYGLAPVILRALRSLKRAHPSQERSRPHLSNGLRCWASGTSIIPTPASFPATICWPPAPLTGSGGWPNSSPSLRVSRVTSRRGF